MPNPNEIPIGTLIGTTEAGEPIYAAPPPQPFSQYNPNDEANKLTPEQIKQAKGTGNIQP